MKFIIKTIITVFILLLSSSATVNAMAGDAVIKGKIIDKETNQALPGVNVIIAHTNIGDATDEHGEYKIINAPTGQIKLVASMIGYNKVRKTIDVKQNEIKSVKFELEQTILEMGAVVVTGTSTPHVVENMPVRTEVIARKAIEKKHACNLSEALSFHTGIRVENNCQNCNFSQVRILGMDGRYSQILIDGDPVVGSLAGVYGLEHFPEEMVDQIEIVKGGGSSLYGGGAIAGVINMITRKPMTNQVRIQYQNNSTGGKPDQHMGAVAETVFKEGTSGAYVFGSYRTRSPYDHNNDGFSELGKLLNESLGFKWYYQPVKNSELLASFHRIHEERRGGNKFDLPVHQADIAEWVEHWRTGGTLRWSHRPTQLLDYRFYYSFAILNRKSYYGGLNGDSPQDKLDALDFYGKTDNPLHIVGIQSNYRANNHLLTAGLQYRYDKIKDNTAAESPYHLDKLYENMGLFFQDNLHFGDKEQLELVAGLRVDRHSELQQWIKSPRLNGKFDIGKGFTLRAAYTTGFKPPQIFDEDLHIGGLEGDQRIVQNNGALNEESSNSISGGIEYLGYFDDLPTMFSLTAFYTRLTDAFTEKYVSKQGNIELWERINSDGAQVRGVELDLGIRPVDDFEIRSGFTYKTSQYDSPHEDFTTRKFLRTPDITGNLRFFLNTSDKLEIYLHSTYIGEMYVPHEILVKGQKDPMLQLERSNSFIQMDVGLTYKLPLNNGLNASMNVGMKNIFNAYQEDLDRGPGRDPSYVYGPTRPRTLFFGFETAF